MYPRKVNTELPAVDSTTRPGADNRTTSAM